MLNIKIRLKIDLWIINEIGGKMKKCQVSLVNMRGKKQPQTMYEICGWATRQILSTLVPDLSRRALNAVEHSIKHGTRHG